MSTPSRQFSGHHFSDGGPPRSVLQQLLEEINDSITFPGASRRRSLAYGTPQFSRDSLSRSQHAASSVWANGGSTAEEARSKLRALDEARQRRHSTNALPNAPVNTAPLKQRQLHHDGAEPSASFNSLQHKEPPSLFNHVNFDRAAIWATTDIRSPQSEYPESTIQDKRERSDTGSPEAIPKRVCTKSQRNHYSSRIQSLSEGSNALIRGDDPMVVSLLYPQKPSFVERKPQLRPGSFEFLDGHIASRLSSFRPTDDAPPNLHLPSTPRQSFSPMDGVASPAHTPAWMRPFHLVDEEKSIYMNVHGEDWMDHPLCLDCFRRHGNFHRILRWGCEVCGQDEILKGHYWELPDRE